MASPTYSEKFDQLRHQLIAVFVTFYAWRAMQKEENNDVYEANNEFWNVVIPALQHEWFMSMARIYENSSYTRSGKVLSVFSLIAEQSDKERAKEAEEFLANNKSVINSINRLRDHLHAHNNAEHLINSADLLKRFPLKYAEIEALLEFTAKLLSLLSPEAGQGWVLDHLQTNAERDVQDVVNGLRYFHNQRKAHRDKYLRGEVESHQFPPGS